MKKGKVLIRYGMLSATVALISVVSSASAQNDPKKTPGASVKVTSVSIVKNKSVRSPQDSTVNVMIKYVKKDGTAAELELSNIPFSKSAVNRDPAKREIN